MDQRPSGFHAIANLTRWRSRVYGPVRGAAGWQAWGKYYLTRNQSALIAFRVPQGTPHGWRPVIQTGDGRPGLWSGGGTHGPLNLDRDLCMIPNVAIHMNRKANDGYTYNPAVDLIPLVGSLETKGAFRKLVAEARLPAGGDPGIRLVPL